MQLQATDYPQSSPKARYGEKIASSTNADGKTEYPHVED
jgi:hypothetical protein